MFAGDDIYIDSSTELMWQDNSDVTTNKMVWQDTKKYCRSINLGGYYDWRLPNLEELTSSIDYSKHNSALKSGFKNITNYQYWTSTLNKDTKMGWNIFASYGGNSLDNLTNTFNVRCVRNLHPEILKFDTFKSVLEEVNKKLGSDDAFDIALELYFGKPKATFLNYYSTEHKLMVTVSFLNEYKNINLEFSLPKTITNIDKYQNKDLDLNGVFDENAKLKAVMLKIDNEVFLAQMK